MKKALWLVAAVAMLAMPVAAEAQGVVRGAEDGARRGNRAAGPVGGAVGTVVGGVVGGVVRGAKGVLGIPDRGYRRGYRCRGYYTSSGRFRCYR